MPEIFDTFCKCVERFLPDHKVKELVARSKLFVFPGRSQDVLPKTFTDEEVQFFKDNFILPFSTIAVEDLASCVILSDTIKEQKGLEEYRLFAECVPFSPKTLENFSNWTSEDNEGAIEGNILITMGDLKLIQEGGSKQYIHGSVFCAFVMNLEKDAINDRSSDFHTNDEYANHTLKNAAVALEEVMFFNNPERFVMEKTPLGYIKRRKSGKRDVKIPRSHQRPIYTILDPKEIKRYMGITESETERNSPRPHERRRHYRHLRSDHFKNKKGQVIVIPATWIGSSEATVGNHQYKVRLDL